MASQLLIQLWYFDTQLDLKQKHSGESLISISEFYVSFNFDMLIHSETSNKNALVAPESRSHEELEILKSELYYVAADAADA